nr:glycosyltransferase [Acidobacteriota bacterium]
MPRQTLTAIVPTLDEEGNIAECLEALAFADEILVVDSGSTDRTREIAAATPRTRVLR